MFLGEILGCHFQGDRRGCGNGRAVGTVSLAFKKY
jgi:hypothetical protein